MFNQKNFLILFLAVVVIALIYALAGDDSEHASNSSKGLKIQSWQAKSGAKVLYVPAPQLPMLDVRVVFDAGSARDNGKPGLAAMTNLLLDHGAGDWDTNQIVERFDDVGAEYRASADRDMASLSLRSLTDKELLDTALQNLKVILQKPAFKAEEFERERKRALVGLKNQKESPETLANIAFYKALYKDHPYATPVSGTIESISALKLEDIKAFYQQYYVAKNAMVVIVGAVDKSQAKEIAERILDGLPGGEKPADLPKPEPLKQPVVIKQDHPSKQTTILVGQDGVLRGDKDYFALYVGNHILGGGGFGSRIVEEIRESRGLAYSSYSFFLPMRVKGPFIMGLQTRNDQADEALKLLMQTLKTFITDGPREAELISTKKNLTGGFPLRIDSNKDIAEYVSMIGFYDLPLDYLTNFNANVEQVTLKQIKDAFKRRVDPDKMVTVMVGGQAAKK